MICANPSKQSLPASHSCSQEVQRARLYFFDNDSVSPSTCPSRTPRYRRRPANTHLLQTQDSVPSLDEHVTVRRSRDSPTPYGSRDSLGKQSPDRSRDQVTLPAQTRSREDARRVHNAKKGKQPYLAKDKTWEDSHGRSTDPTVVGDLRGASRCFVRSITNAS
jgi:hypothetical protein